VGQSTHSLLRAWAPRTARSWGGTLRASAERGATGLRGPFVPSAGRADPTTPPRSGPGRGCCSRRPGRRRGCQRSGRDVEGDEVEDAGGARPWTGAHPAGYRRAWAACQSQIPAATTAAVASAPGPTRSMETKADHRREPQQPDAHRSGEAARVKVAEAMTEQREQRGEPRAWGL